MRAVVIGKGMEWCELTRRGRFEEDEQGNLYSLLTPEGSCSSFGPSRLSCLDAENTDGTFFNETNSTVAMMVIKNCSVQGTVRKEWCWPSCYQPYKLGKVWNSDSRPFTFICDQEDLK